MPLNSYGPFPRRPFLFMRNCVRKGLQGIKEFKYFKYAKKKFTFTICYGTRMFTFEAVLKLLTKCFIYFFRADISTSTCGVNTPHSGNFIFFIVII